MTRKWALGARFSLEDLWVGVRVERPARSYMVRNWIKIHLHLLPCVGLWLAISWEPAVDPLS